MYQQCIPVYDSVSIVYQSVVIGGGGGVEYIQCIKVYPKVYSKVYSKMHQQCIPVYDNVSIMYQSVDICHASDGGGGGGDDGLDSVHLECIRVYSYH